MNIIVAACKNGGIGYKNILPWHIANELKFFKNITVGNGNNAVVMGKNTWNSFKNPLPKRDNYVLSTTMEDYDEVNIIRDIDSITGLLKKKHYELKKRQ